jgi:hypothetical protein
VALTFSRKQVEDQVTQSINQVQELADQKALAISQGKSNRLSTVKSCCSELESLNRTSTSVCVHNSKLANLLIAPTLTTANLDIILHITCLLY